MASINKVESLSSIHVLDFLYPPGETSENILDSITNEFVRHFGNPVFVNDLPPSVTTSGQISSQENENTVVQSKTSKGSSIKVNHNILNIEDFGEDVVDVVVNKNFMCVLFDDDSIRRAKFVSPDDSKFQPLEKSSVRFSNLQDRTEPFQVASDESFARSLERTLNETSNILSGRRSYNIGSQNPIPPPTILINNVPTSYPPLPTGVPPSHFSLSTPTRIRLRANAMNAMYTTRHMPYATNFRQRRIQMGHLLSVSPNPQSMMYPQNSEDQDDLPDDPQLDVLNNITIVSLENEPPPEFQIRGLPTQPDLSFPLVSTGITSGTDDTEIQNPEQDQSQDSQDSSYDEPTQHQLPSIKAFDAFQNSNSPSSSDKSGVSSNRPIPTKSQQADKSQFMYSDHTKTSLKKENYWSSKLGELCESSTMPQKQFVKVTAMESCFLLVDDEGHLWIWDNDSPEILKARFSWNETDNVIAIGCNMHRATLLLESNKYVTFYDKCFKDVNSGVEPELITKLSHEPIKFQELVDEEILDIQCANFYTSVHTASGKVFWWGLAPATERNATKTSRKSNASENLEISVGDLVTPKIDKNEMGCLVFNNVLQKFGIVMECLREEGTNQNPSTKDEKVVVTCIDRDTYDIATDDLMKTFSSIWDLKDVIFLQEHLISIGEVVSFDCQYAIVKMADKYGGDLKVYMKSSVEKVMHNDANSKQTRYKKYLMKTPSQIFANTDFAVVAMSVNEIGHSLLVNRLKDGKAFLIHPSSLTNDHNKWFTCGKSDINKNENIKSECTSTTEFEATPAEESRLCIKKYRSPHGLSENRSLLDQTSGRSIFDISGVADDALLKSQSLRELDIMLNQQDSSCGKFSRSFSMPTGGKTDTNLKRKWRNLGKIGLTDVGPNIVRKPKLFSMGFSQSYTCLLFDNFNCLYPVQFDCSLCNPPLLEILPMKSFVLFDRGEQKNGRLVTVLAVPRRSPLISAICNGDKQAIHKAVMKIEISLEEKDDSDHLDNKTFKRVKFEDGVEVKRPVCNVNQFLDERCNGNQNIMHVAASNILKTDVKIPLHGSIMDVRNNDENVMLHTFLNCPIIWPKIRELLCERDSHGCTPFLTAIIMHNLRGADLILEAVKRDGRSDNKHNHPIDKTLFQNTICRPAFSGLTPIHALIHCSSKKQSSQRWYSTLKVSNLPANYSPRLLLKLFKARYPSAYRAVMPIPEAQWPQITVRKKLAGGVVPYQIDEPTTSKPKVKHGPTPFPRTYVSRRDIQGNVYRAGTSRGYINRADLIRANAKEGLVMFGDINEMYQALSEVDGNSLLTKNVHQSGALLSLVQHLLQVELYQEKTKFSSSHASTQTNATVGTAGGSSGAVKATLISNPLLPSELPYDVGSPKPSTAGGSVSATDISPLMREHTINKCFDDIMVHLLMTSLVTTEPNMLSSVNSEADTALSYFLSTYPRYSPSHLHKLFLNWRPCNQGNCKYNRHVGNITLTSQKDVQPPKPSDNKTNIGDDDKKGAASAHPSQKRKVTDNPILQRRGLQNRTGSLVLNVKNKGNSSSEYASSPITPSIRVIDNLKFGPIEVNACSGLTPQIMQPHTDTFSDTSSVTGAGQGSSRRTMSNLSPFFPINMPAQNRSQMVSPPPTEDECKCHLNKARLLWNTTFQASVFCLAKDWPCIVSSIMCSQSNLSSELKFVDSNKLDIFVENLLLNPYTVLLEVFLKTLMVRFLESKVSENANLLPSLHRLNPIDRSEFTGKTFNSLLPWLTVHRFVRSLVRQLSLSLSKNAMPDGNLKLKIGRYANKNHSKKETRIKECLSLCLKAFSWISVIEILKAANAMLKPIRLGTVKAQPKGIIRDIHNIGQPSFGRGNVPTGVRMHVPTNNSSNNARQNIRYASRRIAHNTPYIPTTATSMLSNENEVTAGTSSASSSSSVAGTASVDNMMLDDGNSSDNEETINIDDPFLFASDNNNENFERSETDINEIDWTQVQGITPDSSLAWALDGHIRMRNEVSNRVLPQAGLFQFSQQNQIHQQIMNTPSVHAGYLYLSRMFCRLVKEATDIAKSVQLNREELVPGFFGVKPLSFGEDVKKALQREANEQLRSTWEWMSEILSTLEQQLSMGDEFDTKHFVLRLKRSAPGGDLSGLGRPSMTHIYGSTPDEYMMYLLKQDMGEDGNSLPVLDLFSYTHLTYVLDAYLYLNKSRAFSPEASHPHTPVNEVNALVDSAEKKYFRPCIDLEKSMLSGEEIKVFLQYTEEKCATANQVFVWLDENILKKQRMKIESQTLAPCEGRWNRVVDAFSTLFLSEGPGYERESFLAIKAGASGRIARFQRTLTSVRGSDSSRRSLTLMQENPSLLINVVRSRLLDDCILFFTENMDNHPYGSLRVRFEGEEGTGPGVNRGLFAAFANALKTGQKYKHWPCEFLVEAGNLPAQKGIFSPKGGKYYLQEESEVYLQHPMTQEKRYTSFVALGRFLGLTLWFNQTIPIIFSRPTLLYLLGKEKEITFDDFAFYDSAMYKSFCRLLADSLSDEFTNESFLELYNFFFEVPVEGCVEELIPGGRNIRVTKQNAFKFVRLFAQHNMIGCRENELQGMRDGLIQMIPKELLDNLEAEDLQLLLSGGVEEISYQRLRSVISFSNSRGCSREVLERYKSWFWKIVQKMTSSERQKLLYFATGSSVLPALDNRVGSNEELSITIDIINNANSLALPMSSTCGQRISMPLYPSKSILRAKILQAIECQTYGLG